MNKKPWIKEDRRVKAENHVEEMNDIFSKEIQYSIENSTVYHDTVSAEYDNGNVPECAIVPLTTELAISKYCSGKTAVLNFASYKYAGGGFIIGAIAQEEALCHASTLYNVISDKRFENYYIKNRANTNNELYDNFAIYSPGVIFPTTEKDYKVDVITCAAPNKKAYMQCSTNELDVTRTMKSRIKFVFDIAQSNYVETLILGVFGCGVFGNDPLEVARIFRTFILSGEYSFKNVIFAIPPGENYEAFAQVFS